MHKTHTIYRKKQLSFTLLIWTLCLTRFLLLDMVWMKRIYAPCATLPLTYTELHPELDVVMHLDTDLIFARPPSELWAEFNRFSPNTLMMMAPEINSAKLEQESKKYYWPTKYQAGLILMNLTRMRSVSFATRVKTISTIFREELKLPVQVNQTQISLKYCFVTESVGLNIFGISHAGRAHSVLSSFPGTNNLLGLRLEYFASLLSDSVSTQVSIHLCYSRMLIRFWTQIKETPLPQNILILSRDQHEKSSSQFLNT